MQFPNRALANFPSTKRWLFWISLLLLGSSSLYGQDSWQGPSGNWFTSSSWSQGFPPNSQLNGLIDNGTTVTITPGPDGQEAFANTLTVGGTHPGSTVVFGPGGILNINNPLQVLNGGIAIFDGGQIAGNLNIVDNGEVQILGNYVQENVDISGTGALIINETTTLLVTANVTNSGPTQILGGTYQAGFAGAFSANSAFTVNSTLDLNGFNNTIGSLSGTGTVINNGSANATLTVGQDNTSTLFSGVLEDGPTATLSLTKIGSGTLTLTGNNTYTGTTSINDGTLVVNGSIASAETTNNATLVVNGTIGGSETINNGVLDVNGTVASTETIDNGTLVLKGTIASAETVVNPGAVLSGTGLIRGNLTNSGLVIPGNPFGALRVAGNYVQNSNGALRISVGGAAAGQFGSLTISGHATLGGTLQLLAVNGFQLSVGDKVTFLTANGGISGNFSNIQNPFISSTAVMAELVVLPNAVQVEGTQGSFVTIISTLGPVVTPNQLSVAKALDSARGDPRMAAIFAFLDSQPLGNLPHDLDLIAPTEISSINATVSMGRVQTSNVGQRMANIHAGSTGFSSSGFALNGDAVSYGSGLAGESGAEGKNGPSVLAPIPENRWGVFVTGLGEFTNVDSTANAGGYNVDTGGITLGVDYRVTPNFAVGVLAGYAHTNLSLNGGGNIDVNGGNFGAYATLFGNGFYLDTAVTGGPTGYDTHREALQGSANGSTDGAELNVIVSAGYDWKQGNLSIGPTATFQFGYVDLSSFTETGSLAPLKFPDQNTESERTAFGARASYQWKVGNVTLIPQVNLAWEHEFGSVAYQVVANFANGAGTSFTVNGPEIGRDSLQIGAGVSIIWSDRLSTYVFYDGDVARTNYDSHSVTGGVRISF